MKNFTYMLIGIAIGFSLVAILAMNMPAPKATSTVMGTTVNAVLVTHTDMQHPIYTSVPDGKVIILETVGNQYMVNYLPEHQFGYININSVVLDK